MKTLQKDNLIVEIYENRTLMGEAAAKDIKTKIAELLAKKTEINIIFAAAPSQNDVLKSLVEDEEIEWNRVNAFHMDEYIGLDKNASQSFGNFLKSHIFGLVPFKSVNYINISASDPEAEAERYAKLLSENPIDIVIMGIGENGHVAFNDPPVADFNDKKLVKIVKLDSICRQQQVNDGCFDSLDKVPTYAMTLTIPMLFNVPNIFCIVPAKTKSKAVYETLNGSIDEHCPSSILRMHDNAKLYLDNESSNLLW
ncbi:MAG: glucosamine-6-phosphate deaminase [Clostridia bacterium]|nr:glucosamine-6-phosphate deaminase [Clostridia bacterium]